jgi:DNA repair protein RadD
VGRIQCVVNVSTVFLGFDEPRLHVDCDMRPTTSLHEWMQRRGRVQRAYPTPLGDRSYQERMIAEFARELAQKRNPLGVAPCGAGKSWIACQIAQRAHDKGKAIGFVTVRRALTHDITDRLTRLGVPHGVIMPGYTDNHHRTKVASIHTMASRGTVLDVDCLFLDEAPIFLGNEFKQVVDRHSHTPRVLLSASPVRADGQGLGRIADSIVMGPTIQELIQFGILVPTRIFTRDVPDTSSLDVNSSGEYNEPQLEKLMSRPAIVGNLVKEWLYRANNLPTIVHAVNLVHAAKIVKKFQEAGVNAVMISAETPDDERRRVFDDMCQDAPPKKEALLLDLAGNVPERFGAPESDREWSLEDSDPKKPHKAVLAIRRCDKCWFTYSGHVPKCPECGNPHVATVREIREKAEALVEYRKQQKDRAIERWREQSGDDKKAEKFSEYLKIAKDKGYKRGWPWARYIGIFKEPPSADVIKKAHHLLRQ